MADKSEREWLPLELVKTSAGYLESKGIPTPRLDAEVLLCAVLDCSRVKLYTIYDEPVTAEELTEYRDMIRRRVAREPVSRILSRREFMGFDFIVTPAVLSPRPETEILVEKVVQLLELSPKIKRSEIYYREQDKKHIAQLKEQVAQMQPDEVPEEVRRIITEYDSEQMLDGAVNASGSALRRILDLGTGSGCIPISIIKHAECVEAVGVDISSAALEVAQRNAEVLDVTDRVKFIESDFFSALDSEHKFDVIVSNPPYLVRGDEEIWPEVAGYDPELALYAADNGLACYREIVNSVGRYLKPGGVLLLELGAGQLGQVTDLVLAKYPAAEVSSLKDYSGIPRVLVVNRIID